MRAGIRRLIAAGLASLALAGCDGNDDTPKPGETDPALSGALSEPLMVDPELSGDQGAAVAVNDGSVTLPPEDRSPEARANARKGALAMAGGTLLPLPQPGKGGAGALAGNALTAAQVAGSSAAAGRGCAAKVQYSNTWAAQLPAEFPVYPRGAVQEAAGTDSGGCALRVVNFLTPVTPADVMAFYYTRAKRAGLPADYRLEGGDHVLGGRKGSRAYVVYARDRQGITEVDLVASGT